MVEAQKRITYQLSKLVHDHKEFQKQLEGITLSMVYEIEDKAYLALPQRLQRDFGLTVQERLTRRYIKDKKGNDIEVNIFGKATQNGKEVTIIGEGKSQLSKNDVREFMRKKLKRLEGVFEHVFPVLITYMISSPDVEDFAKEHGIALYYSYDF